MKIRVGILGRASGVRGEIRVALCTDSPETRFAPGTVLFTNHPDFPCLTVNRAHSSGKHFVASFVEIPDRNLAETMSGIELQVESSNEPPHSDSSAGGMNTPSGNNRENSEAGFYRHELLGLEAVTASGEKLGIVSELVVSTAQDLLEVSTPSGEKILVPFVFEIVPEVDLPAGKIIMNPPGGLFPKRL